jgi:hypothetical protein
MSVVPTIHPKNLACVELSYRASELAEFFEHSNAPSGSENAREFFG